jgi:hypothetical protein
MKKRPLHPTIVLAPMATAFFLGGVAGVVGGFPALLLLLLGVLAGIGWVALQVIFLYQLWVLAQASDLKIKKPTPGKAIGFWFIPFYGLYWTFIVWMNLAKHINNIAGGKKVPVKLVIIGCGLFIASIFVSPNQSSYMNVLAGFFVDLLSMAGVVVLLICNFYFYKAAADISGPPGASASGKKPVASNA